MFDYIFLCNSNQYLNLAFVPFLKSQKIQIKLKILEIYDFATFLRSIFKIATSC